MSRWINRSQASRRGRPLANVLQRRENTVFLGTLVCSLIIFLVLLQVAFSTIWDRVSQSVRQEIEKEADTVARLLVFEFSHLRDLETSSGEDAALELLVKRLLWEKVTFNENIRGIELISRQTDAHGQHLSYVFFPLSHEEPTAQQAPQKTWRSFSGPEGELIRRLLREQRLDQTLLEAVNQGQKLESELLLRYFPLYIPLPERGAVFWGVVKVGLSIDAMRRFLLLLEEEKASLRQDLLWAMAVVTCFALILGLLGFRWQSQKAGTLLKVYTTLATALESGAGMDPVTLQLHLKQQDTQDILEFQQLQRFCGRLGATLQTLAERLVSSEGEASRGRLLSAVLPQLAAGGKNQVAPAAWTGLFAARPESWGEVFLDPHLQQAAGLLQTLVPDGISLKLALQPLPPISGCEAKLILALLLMLDFAVSEMTPPGEALYQAAMPSDGAVAVTLAFPGRRYDQAELARLLQPFQVDQTTSAPLGPFLIAALAQQHGGRLTLTPQTAGGLTMILSLPGQPDIEQG
ncbi:MAG: hypothetical protein ACUVRZ_11105 [Desulfobacca sp.]|uniref:hypothetical protein n=1 Tax=Desulfobacca sp. TaxID=2067990 RepID=UPI004049D845